MGAPHPFCQAALIVIRVVSRQKEPAGIPVYRIILTAIPQIGHGQQAGGIGIVHQDVVAEAVRLVGVYLPVLGMLHHSVGLDAVPDLLRKLPALLRQGLVPVALPADLRPEAQRLHRHHVGGNQVAEAAGVVRGAEARPCHARDVHRTALPLTGQGVRLHAVVAPEEVGGVPVVLLHGKGMDDLPDHLMEFLRKYPVDPRLLPVIVPQIKRGAEGVHLILALPHMGVLQSLVLVSRPRPVGAFVKSIGIGVYADHLRLPGDDALQNLLEPAVLSGILHIGPHLGRGIPQPHGGDVAGDDEVPSVLRLLHRGLHGVQETLGRQRRQRAVVGLVICLQLFCSVLQCLRYRHDFPPFLCQTLSGPPSPGLSLIISAGRQSVNL